MLLCDGENKFPDAMFKIDKMNYQNATLPPGAVKAGSTPSMTEKTVVPGILKKHLAPKGKFGYLVVEEGSLQFIWEDEENYE